LSQRPAWAAHQQDTTWPYGTTQKSPLKRSLDGPPVPPNLTLAKQAGAASFRVLCGKVGDENLDKRTAFASELG